MPRRLHSPCEREAPDEPLWRATIMRDPITRSAAVLGDELDAATAPDRRAGGHRRASASAPPRRHWRWMTPD